jgi:phosphomannomutase
VADLDRIFKAYDIRGRTDLGELDEDLARRVGAAFARFAGGVGVAVGRDCRRSSPGFASAMIEGITSQGVDVLDLGRSPPTPSTTSPANARWPGR